MDHHTDKAVPVIHAGGGGLGGIEGEPMGTDPHGYHPEPSYTGEVKGPAVPANLPEREIIRRIEDGRAMPNIEKERWWTPKPKGWNPPKSSRVTPSRMLFSSLNSTPEGQRFVRSVVDNDNPSIPYDLLNDREGLKLYQDLWNQYDDAIALSSRNDFLCAALMEDQDSKRVVTKLAILHLYAIGHDYYLAA